MHSWSLERGCLESVANQHHSIPTGNEGQGQSERHPRQDREYITERGGTVKVRDVQTRFFKQNTVELARTWLAKQYVDSGRARFEKVGKSLRLVMLEPEEPAVEYDEDDDLTPADRVDSRKAGRLENTAAPGMRRNTFPAMEPYEIEPGVFDFGDCVVDIRELVRNSRNGRPPPDGVRSAHRSRLSGQGKKRIAPIAP